MTARYRMVGGDIFTTDLSTVPADLVIVANLCHLFDSATNRRLLARLVDGLTPGGYVAVIEPLSDDGNDEHPLIALYRLDLATRTQSGGVTSFAEVSAWMGSAGCDEIGRIELGVTPPVSMVLGRRPTR